MPRRRPPYLQVLEQHRARLNRLIDRRGVEQVKEIYDEAAAELGGQLKALTSQRLGQTFDAHTQRLILAQVQQGQVVLAKRIKGELGDLDAETQVESIRGLSKGLERLWSEYRGEEIQVPIDEAASLRSLIGRRARQLDDMHAKSLASWGTRTFEKVHKSLSLSIAIAEPTDKAIARLISPKTGNPELGWADAERIVVTETAFAANAAHYDGMLEAAKDMPELMMRWVEHVSDITGDPLDDRVCPDSIALHGQVARPGALFIMPEDEEVEPEMWGMTWAHPPNRPRDRAVLAPWFPGIGVPAWTWRRGRRVEIE